MQRDEHVSAGSGAEIIERAGALRLLEVEQERIDHDVADEKDPLGPHSLAQQIRLRFRRGRETVAREDIGDHAVDLLGHREIEAPEPRLDVGDGDERLRRDERACQGRVHVPDDDDEIGTLARDDRFERDHDPRGLLRVGSGADAEMNIGLGKLEIVEEDPRHVLVVVLPRMDQRAFEAAALPELADERRRLHEIRAGADDDGRLHRFSFRRDDSPIRER